MSKKLTKDIASEEEKIEEKAVKKVAKKVSKTPVKSADTKATKKATTEKAVEKTDAKKDAKETKVTPKKAVTKKEKVSKKDIKEYAKILSEEKYTNYQKPESIDEEEEDDDWVTLPYVISPDEFGEKDDYEMVTLTYFQDGYLCDDDGFLIEDVEGMIGKKSLETFGQYEEDSVFVRNEERKTDYEILLDYRNYTDVEEDRNI